MELEIARDFMTGKYYYWLYGGDGDSTRLIGEDFEVIANEETATADIKIKNVPYTYLIDLGMTIPDIDGGY